MPAASGDRVPRWWGVLHRMRGPGPVKLIRNKVPELARNKGQFMNCESAPSCTHWVWLLRKLTEEVEELAGAVDEDSLLEELADVYEVIRATAGRMQLNMEVVVGVAAEKRQRSGDFSYMLIWDEEL